MNKFPNLSQVNDIRDFFSDLFKIIKLPHAVRDRYYKRFAPDSNLDPEIEFANAFANFPVRVVAAPLERSKAITRLDNLQNDEGNSLVNFYNQRRTEHLNAHDARPICMMTRLPFCKEKAVYVIHDTDAIGTRLFDCPGPIYSFWVAGQNEPDFRLYMQKAKDFFAWEYMVNSINAFIGAIDEN